MLSPSLYVSHGAPPLLEDAAWTTQLHDWARALPKPKAILIVSAHGEAAPLSNSSTTPHTDLVYDFGGFDPLYQRMRYDTPDASEPGRLLALGARLRTLREQGVLVIGSGFMTHGLPYVDWHRPDVGPGWSADVDRWAAEALSRGDVEELAHLRTRSPGMPHAHPAVEHFTPLFVRLGASTDPEAAVRTTVDGFLLAWRSVPSRPPDRYWTASRR